MNQMAAQSTKSNPVRDKSYAFALRITRAAYYLINQRKEYVLSKQLLRSGTSIGANIEEGTQAQSKKDFIAKFQISLKESYENHFWIRLLRDAGFLEQKEAASLLADIDEIIRLLTAILRTSKKNTVQK